MESSQLLNRNTSKRAACAKCPPPPQIVGVESERVNCVAFPGRLPAFINVNIDSDGQCTWALLPQLAFWPRGPRQLEDIERGQGGDKNGS